MTGRVPAHDIKRIYLHEPPRIEENIHTPRERRQAWKEGRLGDNPNPIVPDAEKSGKPKQQRQVDVRKRSDDNYGRLVHGMRKALATWVPIVRVFLQPTDRILIPLLTIGDVNS